MLNDRFNGGARNDLRNKFRDKKFVSAVAIGVFVLILIIVLIAKGCSGKTKPIEQPQPPTGEQAATQQQQIQPIDVPPPPPVEYVKTAGEWREEGKKLLNEKKFDKAREALAEAAKLGDKQAKILLAKDPRLKVRK